MGEGVGEPFDGLVEGVVVDGEADAQVVRRVERVAWDGGHVRGLQEGGIAQAPQLFDDDVVAGHRYGAASKRQNFRQHLERRSESGDLREDLKSSPTVSHDGQPVGTADGAKS